MSTYVSRSGEHLQEQLDALRAQSRTYRGMAASQKQIIKDDRTLSEIGKHEKLNVIDQELNTKIFSLQAEEDCLIKKHLEKVEEIFFDQTARTTEDRLAVRDAYARADALPDEDAAIRTIKRAQETKDESLALAVMKRARESGWLKALQTYSAERPHHRDALIQLNHWTAELEDPGRKMARFLHY